MGGGLERGNVTPAAEFNVFFDPEAALLRSYHANVGTDRPGAYVHDAMALAVLVWPELFERRPARLSVVTDGGAERGRTVADFASGEPNAEVVVDLDAGRFLERLFERLRSYPRAGTIPA
jgi:purine nucleosidase